MGFHDIQNFNKAMLAKQVYGLHHKRDTLLYKVFNSKYFPEGNILGASIPSKCSYAWISILQSREVIQKGKFGGLVMVVLLVFGTIIGYSNQVEER